MKERNGYTLTIFAVGLFNAFGTPFMFQKERWLEFLIIASLIVCLDLFPIKLLSGDAYSANTIGFLYLLFEFNWFNCSIAILVSVLAYYIKSSGSFLKVNGFRCFVTVGMYSISAAGSLLVIEATEHLHIIVRVLLAAFSFELINLLLLSGILRTAAGIPFFQKFSAKLRESLVPILICMVVLPRFLIIHSVTELFLEAIYTGFFLVIIIFFSKNYINQIFLSRNKSQEFVRLLENRTAARMAGHGNRVGTICEIVLDYIDYPKKLKEDLIQITIIHDIGKSLLPSHVFEKRGALTLSEEKEYQSHCEKGAEIVRTIYSEEHYADWVRYHHEAWNGKGFPRGLKRTEIPLESRIIALCNKLDHIMNRHQDDATVLQLLEELSGGLLDPFLVVKIDLPAIASIRESLPNEAVSDLKESFRADSPSQPESKGHIGESFFLRYAERLIVNDNLSIPYDEISRLARLSLSMEQKLHETIEHDDKTFDVYFSPVDSEVMIFVHDISPMLEYKKATQFQILESYQDVILALSSNKIRLCIRREELSAGLGQYIDSMQVNNVHDIPASRSFVSERLPIYHLVQSKMKVLLAVSEATTNVIKHATGGVVSLYCREDSLQVLITDKGSGIPLHEIPKTILVSGYSSKRSLGKGFSLMSMFSDQIMVHTSSSGTSILMNFNKST